MSEGGYTTPEDEGDDDIASPSQTDPRSATGGDLVPQMTDPQPAAASRGHSTQKPPAGSSTPPPPPRRSSTMVSLTTDGAGPSPQQCRSASSAPFGRSASSRKPPGLRLEGVTSAIALPEEAEAAPSPQVSSIRDDSRADIGPVHGSHLMSLSSVEPAASSPAETPSAAAPAPPPAPAPAPAPVTSAGGRTTAPKGPVDSAPVSAVVSPVTAGVDLSESDFADSTSVAVSRTMSRLPPPAARSSQASSPAPLTPQPAQPPAPPPVAAPPPAPASPPPPSVHDGQRDEGPAGAVLLTTAPAMRGMHFADHFPIAPPLYPPPQESQLRESADVLAKLVSAYAELRRKGPELPDDSGESDDVRRRPVQRRKQPPPVFETERRVAGVTEKVGRDRAGLEHALRARSRQDSRVEEKILDLVLKLLKRTAPGHVRVPLRAARRADTDPPADAVPRMRAHSRAFSPGVPAPLPQPAVPAGRPAGWGSLDTGAAATAFSEEGDLGRLCYENLQRYVVARAERPDPLTAGSAVPETHARASLLACRLAVCDLLGCMIDAVRHQSNCEHPIATYLLQTVPGVGGALREIVSACAHSLPCEQVVPRDGVPATWSASVRSERPNAYRIEYWVRRSHLLECCDALRRALRDLEGMCADARPAESEQDTSVFAVRDSRCIELIVTPNGASRGQTAASQGPQVVAAGVFDALREDMQTRFFADVGKHIDRGTAAHCLSQALHELILDDVIRDGVVQRAARLAQAGPTGARRRLQTALDRIAGELPAADDGSVGEQ
eukprot:TRINITY_DN32744_c0_g1_i1.p1 TRINITY_DN32744_c0_g1~~TRINITY_DN32744_c0_g1_i1.p1  ORF type:complete len:780 (+),score=196.20 TRINITY_DN32744_c0_g1_i1:115-2454(+)